MIWDCPTWPSNQRKNILTNTNWDLTYNKKTSSTSQHGDLNVAQVGVQPTNSMIYSETAGMTNIHRCMGICRCLTINPKTSNYNPNHWSFWRGKLRVTWGTPILRNTSCSTMDQWRVSRVNFFKRYANVNTKYIKKPGNSGCSSLQHHVL